MFLKAVCVRARAHIHFLHSIWLSAWLSNTGQELGGRLNHQLLSPWKCHVFYYHCHPTVAFRRPPKTLPTLSLIATFITQRRHDSSIFQTNHQEVKWFAQQPLIRVRVSSSQRCVFPARKTPHEHLKNVEINYVLSQQMFTIKRQL